MSTKKAEIKKIVLELGGVEVDLSLDQAKKMHSLLDDMFGGKEVVSDYPRPIIIDRYRPYWNWRDTHWYTNTSDKLEYKPKDQSVWMSLNTQG